MGHLFINRANLLNFSCDAWALPCDADLKVNRGWSDSIRSPIRDLVDDSASIDVRWPEDWGDYGVRVIRLAAREPSVWLVNTGGTESTERSWYFKGITEFLDAAAAVPAGDKRAVPLIALPFVGSRSGGMSANRGGYLHELVLWLREQAASRKIDIVLSLTKSDAFAAAQAVRRTSTVAWWPEIDDDMAGEAAALASDARDGRLVAFLGAGVSVGAGLPLWGEMLDGLLDENGFGSEDIAKRFGHLDRARLIEQRLASKPGGFKGLLGDRLGQKQRYSLAHSLLAGLRLTENVTTNYDRLYESAIADTNRRIAVLPYDSVDGADGWVLKLHGSLDHDEDIVITRGDYLRYAQRRGALAGIVQALLITRRMLFVGFSLDDENFHSIVDDVRQAVDVRDEASRTPFGTALVLNHHQALEELWQGEIRLVVPGRPEIELAERARLLEIFLDCLLAHASTGSDHLLDPGFAEALSDSQLSLAAALSQFAKDVPENASDAPEWARVQALLDSFGLPPTTGTLIRKGTHCDTKQKFADILRRWYENTNEDTIGDLRSHYGVTTWMTVSASGHRCVVHADTSRDAIRRYLELVEDHGPDLSWRVERGRRGTLNKVCVELNGAPTPGLFIYTARAFESPASI